MVSSTEPNQYDLGDEVIVTGTFVDQDDDDAPVDPDTVTLYVKDPAGTVTTHEYGGSGSDITRESEGIYTMPIDANQPGWWYYRWVATGEGQSAEEKSFEVLYAEAVPEEEES